jgi:predicted MPP superfamily phosphohydrolase
MQRVAFEDRDGEKGPFSRYFFAPRHVLNAVTIEIPGWPADSILRIAVLADLHLGSHAGDVLRLEAIVGEVNALSADLILLPGDFVNAMLWGRGRIPPERVAELLSPLKAPLGVFAVIGNHDRDLDGPRVERALEAHGVAVLENKTACIKSGGAEINILGLSDARSGRPELSFLTNLSDTGPTIILTHDPVLFAKLPSGPHLMVCGHTHGGQIKLPVLGVLTNASEAPLRWTAGLIEENGRRLFVSTGLGTSGLPFRLGVPPEIALLTVRR